MGPCQSCHAGCCRSFAVPVTGADILRIQRELNLSFWDFVCRWADPDGNIAQQYAPHFHFPDEPETPFVISLLHTASRTFPNTSKCRFLVECPPDEEHPLGQARCGIYSARPSACRVFPTRLNDSGELAVIQNVPEKGRSAGDHEAYDLCPRPWDPSDLDPLQTPQDLVIARYEMTFFHRIADIWNRAPRTWDVFPDFLELVYSRRIQYESADEDAPAVIQFPDRDERPSSRAA